MTSAFLFVDFMFTKIFPDNKFQHHDYKPKGPNDNTNSNVSLVYLRFSVNILSLSYNANKNRELKLAIILSGNDFDNHDNINKSRID